MRTLFGPALLIGLALGATAQDKKDAPPDPKKLIGAWELKGAKKGAPVPRLEFAPGGTVTLTGEIDGKPATFTGTYALAGDRLTFELKSKDDAFKDTVTLTKLDDEELVARDADGKTETFGRVRPAGKK